MAVAIWDHGPDAGELLEARLARGWKPTPTATCEGEVVLGYAACLRVARGPGDRVAGPSQTGP
jgi:hypothetical protein